MNAEEVKTIREKLQLTQEKIAEKVGVSFQTFNNWETGKTLPRRNNEAKLRALMEEKSPTITANDNNIIQTGNNDKVECSHLLKKALNEVTELRKALIEQQDKFLNIINNLTNK